MTAPPFADPADAAAYAMYRQEQETEYGMWVAATDIMVGAVLGFTKGMSVPASTVAREGWDAQGLVELAPKTGVQRAAQLQTRRAQLAREQAAIDAELEEARAAQEEADAPPDPGPYKGMKVDELRAELEGRGLDTDGLKPELLARLLADDEEDEADRAEKADDDDEVED